MMKYEMTKFSPHHMNYVLVEAWDFFNMSAGNIIRDRFAKNFYLPSSLPTQQETPRHVMPRSKYILNPRLKK